MDNSRLIKSTSLTKYNLSDNPSKQHLNPFNQKSIHAESYINALPFANQIPFDLSQQNSYFIPFVHKDQPVKPGQSNSYLLKNQEKLRFSMEPQLQRGSLEIDEGDKSTQNGNILNRGENIGSKIKIKAQMHRISSKSINGSQICIKTQRPKDNLQNSRQKVMQHQTIVQWLTSEVSNLVTRITKFENKLERLEGQYRKSEEDNQKHYQAQMQQINNIFNLVQKSQKRSDSLRMMKMLEQMRQNILELHSQISNLQKQQQDIRTDHQSRIDQLNSSKLLPLPMNNDKQMLKRILKLQEWQNSHADDFFLKKIQVQIGKQQELTKIKIDNLRGQFEKNEFKLVESGRKFEGRMTTLVYEERLVNNDQNKNVVIFQKRYYLDVDGFLLDENCCYLLNRVGQSIQLHQSQIQLLRKHRLL